MKYTNNDIEWINIKAFIEERRKVEQFDSFDKDALVSIASDNEVVFFDEEKVRQEAVSVISKSKEKYYGLMESLYQQMKNINTNYYGRVDMAMTRRNMKKWEDMNMRELLSDIDPMFSLNIVTKYYTKEDANKKFF